jgi:hypothetical protein
VSYLLSSARWERESDLVKMTGLGKETTLSIIGVEFPLSCFVSLDSIPFQFIPSLRLPSLSFLAFPSFRSEEDRESFGPDLALRPEE